MSDIQATLQQWLQQDKARCDIVNAARQLQLPDSYLAAGFVRNMAWDNLHGVTSPTPLNDVDLIYFDNTDLSTETEIQIESSLSHLLPDVNWEVRNQARMHLKYQDPPYSNSLDAMSYWVELETAVGLRLHDLVFASVYGLERLFALTVTPNKRRPLHVFQQRISKKNWLTLWPKLAVINDSADLPTTRD